MCSQQELLSDFKRITVCSLPGSEECPFLYPSDDGKEWSPDSPLTPRPGPQRVHCGTQTEGPRPSPAILEPDSPQVSLLVTAAAVTVPTMALCTSPLPQRNPRHCAKWENRASIMAKEPKEESKPAYESLELVGIVGFCPPPPPHLLTECCSLPSSLSFSLFLPLCLFLIFQGQPAAAERQRDTTEEAEGGRARGRDTKDNAEEARPAPRGGRLLLLELWEAGAAPLWQHFTILRTTVLLIIYSQERMAARACVILKKEKKKKSSIRIVKKMGKTIASRRHKPTVSV